MNDSLGGNLRVAVIGVGLMGGSLGLAAREHAGAVSVSGYGRSRDNLELALERGAITVIADSLEEAAAGADLIFVATPVRLVLEHVRRALQAAPAGAVVTDVGSTKGALMRGLSDEQQAALHRGAPAVWFRSCRCGQRPRGSLRGRDLLPDARHARGPRCLSAPARVRGQDRRSPGGDRPGAARSADGAHEPLAARARQSAYDASRTLFGLARRSAGGGSELSRPDARGRQQPPRLDRHLPREPRRPADGAGGVPGRSAADGGGAGGERRRHARRSHRTGGRAPRAHADRRQSGCRASCSAWWSRSPTGRA